MIFAHCEIDPNTITSIGILSTTEKNRHFFSSEIFQTSDYIAKGSLTLQCELKSSLASHFYDIKTWIYLYDEDQ